MEPNLVAPRVVPANPAIGARGDLHIYLPQNSAGPHPFVLGIHGGGWAKGDQNTYRFLSSKLNPLGVGVVLASYQLSFMAPFPAAYEDLLVALRWLRERGAKHGLDPSRCVLFGSSAGGNLAMLLATRAVAENQPRPEVRGVAQYCGIMDLAAQYGWDAERGSTITQDFLRSSPEEAPALYRSGSPIEHVHGAMPPVWMVHGTADEQVSPAQSHAMAERLRELNQEVTFREAPGLGHTYKVKRDGGASQSIEMLFEEDFLRFVRHSLNVGD